MDGFDMVFPVDGLEITSLDSVKYRHLCKSKGKGTKHPCTSKSNGKWVHEFLQVFCLLLFPWAKLNSPGMGQVAMENYMATVICDMEALGYLFSLLQRL